MVPVRTRVGAMDRDRRMTTPPLKREEAPTKEAAAPEDRPQKGFSGVLAPFTLLFSNPIFRRVVRNAGFLFSASGLAAGLAMVQSVLTARLLGVSEFGILGAIILFTSVINNLLSFRMGEVVVKYVGEYVEREDLARAAATFKAAALTEMGASLLAFGILYLLAPLGARYLAKDSNLSTLFTFYGLVVLANLIAESSTGLLQIYDRFQWIAALNLLGNFATLLIVALVFLLRGDLLGVLTAYLVGKSLSAVALTLTALHQARFRWGAGWWRAPLRLLSPRFGEMAGFAFHTNLSASISLVTKDSELLWVSLLRNPLETGYYKLALALSNLIQMPVNPLPQATYAELSRQAARQEWQEMKGLLRRGSLLAGGYTLSATLFLVIFGQPLISILYTSEFLPAFPALVILLIGLLAANTLYWRRPALLALGEAAFPAQVNFVLAILKVAAIFWLVPRYGYLACAALLSAFYLLGSAITTWKVARLMPSQPSYPHASTEKGETQG